MGHRFSREREGFPALASDVSLYGADNWTAADVGILVVFFPPRHCGFSRVDGLRVN